MALRTASDMDGLRALLGERVGPSRWREVPQQLVDAFADVSGDHQWIHVDPERARAESPFGTTVAHGNLTLSMVDGLRADLIALPLARMGVNYGWDRVRFPAPVPTGSRIRAWAETTALEEVGGGWWHLVTRFTVEVEGRDKPACVADSVGRLLV